MREILLYFSLLYNGSFDDIYKALENKEQVDYDKLNQWKREMDFDYITILDEDYPEALKLISFPPFVLFYKGNKEYLKEEMYSIVGMREASDYGKTMALRIAESLSSHSIGVVSGMARGIDAYSHIGSMNSNGKTIAVLGCGINYCYPKENRELYERLCRDHLVLSEYPFPLKPRKDYFPKRNRIVTGLGKKLVVVESQRKGGSMISVGFALEQGKDVLCVPQKFEINDGCNYLISLGAKILLSLDELYE